MADEVKIEEAEGVLKGGYVPWLKEKYPFSKLTPAEFTDSTQTTVKGPSFLIAKADNPPSVLARGRKRFKHCNFISKKVDADGNVRVWLHPKSPLPTERAISGGAAPKTEPAKSKTVAAKKATPAAATKPATDEQVVVG